MCFVRPIGDGVVGRVKNVACVFDHVEQLVAFFIGLLESLGGEKGREKERTGKTFSIIADIFDGVTGVAAAYVGFFCSNLQVFCNKPFCFYYFEHLLSASFRPVFQVVDLAAQRTSSQNGSAR
jgi:hypothetical protein